MAQATPMSWVQFN